MPRAFRPTYNVLCRSFLDQLWRNNRSARDCVERCFSTICSHLQRSTDICKETTSDVHIFQNDKRNVLSLEIIVNFVQLHHAIRCFENRFGDDFQVGLTRFLRCSRFVICERKDSDRIVDGSERTILPEWCSGCWFSSSTEPVSSERFSSTMPESWKGYLFIM